MYAAKPMLPPAGPLISTMSLEALGIEANALFASAPASAAWVSANRTVYVPVRPMFTILAKRMFVLSGATVGTDTTTVALYASDASLLPATRLVTASATAANANACQFFDITDTILTGGQLYYMAMAISGTTATVFRVSSFGGVGQTGQMHFFTQNANCPSPATPVIAATGFVPVFGLDLRGAP